MKLCMCLAAVLFLAPALADPPNARQVHFAACVRPGVESGCLIARSDDGKDYDVTGAVPGLKAHDWLQGTATISNRVSMCMQGQTITGFKRDQNQAAANCMGGGGN